MRVLIVDDDAAMAELLRSVCEADGHEAVTRGSSLEAVAHLQTQPVDLLITDIAMAPPDGLELVRTARSLQPDLIAIAVTGYWGRYSLPEVLATGALDLMFKPFRVEELRARLAMAAERRRMAQAEQGRTSRIAATLERVRVLLIDPDWRDAVSLEELLADPAGGPFEVTHVPNLEGAMDHLGSAAVDLVLLDLETLASPGLELIKRVRAAAPGVPLVVLSSFDSHQITTASLLQAGAQDHVVKGRLNQHPLQRVLFHAIERQRLQDEAEAVRQQEQKLREEMVLHEMQLKDEFMSHVSHELRSPLTAIHQFSTILSDGLAGPLSEDQREALRVITRNIHQLEAMIDDLLEVTRMQTGKLSIELQSVLPEEVVEDASMTLGGPAQAKGVSIVAETAADLPTAYADPVRTRQVLINLVGNAVKFTPEGGTITVRVTRDEDPGFLRFEVADTGCGLTPEACERIFDRLYQVKGATQAGRKGLGLGLFICKELVVQLGGRIWVESELGRGSSFLFTLPVFGPNTPIRTREVRVKRDLLARVEGPQGPITPVSAGGADGEEEDPDR